MFLNNLGRFTQGKLLLADLHYVFQSFIHFTERMGYERNLLSKQNKRITAPMHMWVLRVPGSSIIFFKKSYQVSSWQVKESSYFPLVMAERHLLQSTRTDLGGWLQEQSFLENQQFYFVWKKELKCPWMAFPFWSPCQKLKLQPRGPNTNPGDYPKFKEWLHITFFTILYL